MPFKIGKLGHAVLVVRDIDASVQFYTQVLGFKVSDVYPDSMVEPAVALSVVTSRVILC
jgi:catechol 2,3-dioxygenase-like lactoylglutathione lyase family enzyme